MAKAVYGYNVAVGLETESTYGADPGGTRDWLEFQSESVERTFETIIQEDTRGRVERNNDSQGNQTVSGSFSVFVNSENIGHLLYYILGNASSPSEQTAGEADYQHKIDIDLSTMPSFTYEVDYGEAASEAKIATGCKMSSLSVDISEDGLVTTSADLTGQDLDPKASPTSVTFKSWPRTFDFKDFTFKVEGTDETTDIVGGTINIDSNNVEDDYRQSTQYVHSIPAGAISVSIDLTVAYDSAQTTATQDFFNGTDTDKSVSIEWVGEQINSGNNHKLSFSFPNCYCESATPTVSGPGEIVQRSVTIKPLHDYGSTDDSVDVTLVNNKGTQYS